MPSKSSLKRFVNESRGATLAVSARTADNFFARLRGLLFTPPLKKGQGLYISPCAAIHMLGMTYAIDAVFISKEMRVVGLVERLGPWRVSAYFAGAAGCLELPPGTIADTDTRVDDVVRMEEI